MKTKIILIATFASLIFTACQKEDESENPYNQTTDNTDTSDNQKTYFFTDEDKQFVLYQVADSFKMLKNDEDTVYYRVKSITYDTLKNQDSINYERALVRIEKKSTYNNIDYYSEYGFIQMTRKKGILEYYVALMMAFEDFNDIYENKGICYQVQEKHSSIVLNGKTYNNVYRVEQDSSYNYIGPCYIKRAWILPGKGIIDINEGCEHKYLID